MKTFSRNPDGNGLYHILPSLATIRRKQQGAFSLHAETTFIAGTFIEMRFRFTCGAQSLGSGDCLGVAWRLPCDWGHLQFTNPSAPNYATAIAPEGIAVHLDYQPRGGVKPWHHVLVARLSGRSLQAGQEIELVLGDRSRESPGWECQRAAVNEHQFLGLLRVRSESHWVELPGIDPIRIQGGPPESLSLTAPSDCSTGESVELTIRLDDRHGNASIYEGQEIRLQGPGMKVQKIEPVTGWQEPIAVWRATVKFNRSDRLRVRALAPKLGLAAESNPIDCTDEQQDLHLFWGDLHAGQCSLGCGQGTLDEFYRYARHVAGLQFASHQPNDVYMTHEDWANARTTTEEANDEGHFVTFHGCEWTALPGAGGDRNVFYLRDQTELHRAGRWYREEVADSWRDAGSPTELYALLTDTEALINLHAGGFTSELEWSDPRLEGLVEIHSTHGTSSWLVETALEQGRKIGLSAGTDGISGRPGSCRPGRRETRNLPNGCFGVYSSRLTREDLWRSISARRCYATDGERIRLSLRAGGAFMGEDLTTDALPPLQIEVAGTAAIERVVVRRGASQIAVRELWDEDPDHLDRYRLLWCGTRKAGSFHAQALSWCGSLRAHPGSLELVAPVGFFADTDELAQEGEGIAWQTVTAGNRAGFLFDVPSQPTHLSLETSRLTMQVDLAKRKTVRRDVDLAGGTGYVELSRAPDPTGRRDISLEVDLQEVPLPGTHAYWIEVDQVNGSRAWSSPIYVTYR